MAPSSLTSTLSPSDRRSRAVPVGIVGLVIAVLYVVRVLIPHDMDPTIFLALGEDSPETTRYASNLLGDVQTRTFFGHDGKFFFAQANDPWYLDPDSHASVLDRPTYRAQRMLYPLVASGFGTLGPSAVLLGLLLVNIVAVAIGSWLTAQLSLIHGATRWLGLAFALNWGVITELDIDGAGIMALAFGVAAALAASLGRFQWAAGYLAGASLSREVMLAFALGLAAWVWPRTRKAAPMLVLVPAIAVIGWSVYVRIRLGYLPTGGPLTQSFTAPFSGVIGAIPYWIQEPLYGLISAVLLILLFVFARRVFGSGSPLVWAASPFVLVAVLLSVFVWREPYDITRAIAPVLLAYPFTLLSAPRLRRLFPKASPLE